MKSGNFDLLEPLGPVLDCAGIAVPFALLSGVSHVVGWQFVAAPQHYCVWLFSVNVQLLCKCLCSNSEYFGRSVLVMSLSVHSRTFVNRCTGLLGIQNIRGTNISFFCLLYLLRSSMQETGSVRVYPYFPFKNRKRNRLQNQQLPPMCLYVTVLQFTNHTINFHQSFCEHFAIFLNRSKISDESLSVFIN